MSPIQDQEAVRVSEDSVGLVRKGVMWRRRHGVGASYVPLAGQVPGPYLRCQHVNSPWAKVFPAVLSLCVRHFPVRYNVAVKQKLLRRITGGA